MLGLHPHECQGSKFTSRLFIFDKMIVIHLSVVFNVVSGQCSWKPECLLFVLIKNMRNSQHNVESDTWMR